jgi:hypothetical protein
MLLRFRTQLPSHFSDFEMPVWIWPRAPEYRVSTPCPLRAERIKPIEQESPPW